MVIFALYAIDTIHHLLSCPNGNTGGMENKQ